MHNLVMLLDTDVWHLGMDCSSAEETLQNGKLENDIVKIRRNGSLVANRQID